LSQPRSYSFKTIFSTVIWVLLGCGTVILLVAAMKQKNNSRCFGLEIKITGVQNNFFIDKIDVIRFLERTVGKPEGRLMSSFDLYRLEAMLEKNEWIKNAELFFDNNEKLVVNILEREPVARIFAVDGSSFYIDTSTKKLSLSEKFSARVPVFTNFPVMAAVHSKADSNLLNDVKDLGDFILHDPFWMAQIDQVNITSGGTFELIPKVGNQLIVFGTAENCKEKFDHLLLFYKKVESKVGWNKYSQINVSFKGQIIGVKRGAEEIKMDSLRTIQLMKTLAANAQSQATDSASNIQLVQPLDDNSVPVAASGDETFPEEQSPLPAPHENESIKPKTNTPIISTHVPEKPFWQPVVKSSTPVLKKVKPPVFKSIEKPNPYLHKPPAKLITKKPADKPKGKPKAVMPPPNDY
jgi:cell division protein FtsQ